MFVSEAVVREASAGDVKAAKRRLESIKGIPDLQITNEARDLAKVLVRKGGFPSTASVDILHVAVATSNGMDYLLTWNCRHIANATFQESMRAVCKDAGCTLPIICAPLELIEE